MTFRLSHFVLIALLVIVAFVLWRHRDKIIGAFKR